MKKIRECEDFSSICNFACCNHDDNSSFSLWMYPGEYQNTVLDKSHIEVIGIQNGAVLGKCTCTNEQKRLCDGKKWFKPLDCWSYPFFPFIERGKLVLKVDITRCPLSKYCDLEEQYIQIYQIWKRIIKDEKVFHALEQLNWINFQNYL